MVLCFVDFASPAYAATAMDALQGKIEKYNVILVTPFPHEKNSEQVKNYGLNYELVLNHGRLKETLLLTRSWKIEKNHYCC